MLRKVGAIYEFFGMPTLKNASERTNRFLVFMWLLKFNVVFKVLWFLLLIVRAFF
jgi:hypothetical protein